MPGAHGFFDDVLDRGPVDHRQHLFGHALRGGKEAGAEAGGRDDGLTDLVQRSLRNRYPTSNSSRRSNRRMLAACRTITSTRERGQDQDLPEVVARERGDDREQDRDQQ